MARTQIPSADAAASLQHWTNFAPAQTAGSRQVDAVITGASGFIGQHLARRLLSQGKRVRLLARKSTALQSFSRQGAEVAPLDLSSAAELRRHIPGAQVVFHLAAKTCAFSREEMFQVNAEGTRLLAEACAAQETPPVLVYVSSVAAAGPTSRGTIRTETDRPRPISIYGASKYAGEMALLPWAAQVPCTVVRPGIVYGPANRELLPIFQTIQRLNLHPVVGWRTPPLSYSWIDDTLEILLRAGEFGTRLRAGEANDEGRLHAGQGVYFAVGEEHADYADLGRIVARLMGRPGVAILPLLGPAPWIAAGTNELLARWRGHSDTFNCDKIREALADSWACSPHRVQTELRFTPALPLADRLAETLAWYRAEQWL